MSAGTARLRQAVVATDSLERLEGELRAALDLGEPYRDPGVGEFGLRNAVFTIGDCFLEVVSPVRPGTAAGRRIERAGGDCGYMLMFELDDLQAARSRAAALGIREVWSIELADISSVHLHPADVGGTIVSLDEPRARGSWRWGGPAWEGARGPSGPGGLTGASVAIPDPVAAAERWGRLLDVSAADPGTLALDGAELRLLACEGGHGPGGLVEIAVDGLRVPAPVQLGGVALVAQRR